MNIAETKHSRNQYPSIHYNRERGKMNMERNSGGRCGRMKLRKVRTRDDMSIVEEDYHTGSSASVPFKWESEPGTPKANFRENGAFFSPDLTPPPSHFSNHNHINSPLTLISSKPISPKTNFLNSLFRKLSIKSSPHPTSPGSLSSSSSSSTSYSMERQSPQRLSCDSRVDDDDDENVESPVSTLFFGRGSDKGCYPKLVKVFTKDSK